MTKHKVLVVCLFYCEYFLMQKCLQVVTRIYYPIFFHIVKNHFYHHIAHVLGTTCYDQHFFLVKIHQKVKNYKLL